MHSRLAGLLRLPPLRSAENRIVDTSRMIGVVAATLLLLAEITGVSFAFVWAVSNYLYLSQDIKMALYALTLAGVLWSSAYVWIVVFNSETSPDE